MVKPIFCVVLRDGGEWTVEAEWPDGTIENVDAFTSSRQRLDSESNRKDGWRNE